MNYLAIDLGDQRTGIAVGDDALCIAHPLKVIEVPLGDDLVQSITTIAAGHNADLFVLGLPLHMDGSEGNRATLTRRFGQKLQEASGIQVVYQDERLTSAAAEEPGHRNGPVQRLPRVRD